jgi:hypothetical protein
MNSTNHLDKSDVYKPDKNLPLGPPGKLVSTKLEAMSVTTLAER